MKEEDFYRSPVNSVVGGNVDTTCKSEPDEDNEINGNIISVSENYEVKPLVMAVQNSDPSSTVDNPIIINDDIQDLPVSNNGQLIVKCENNDNESDEETSSTDDTPVVSSDSHDSLLLQQSPNPSLSRSNDTLEEDDTLEDEEKDEDETIRDHADEDEESNETSDDECGENKGSDVVRPGPSYITVKSPNFELRKLLCGSTHLFVFTSDDHTFCYRYYSVSESRYRCSECMNKEGRSVYAAIKKDSDGENYVEMSDAHTCDMIEYYGKHVIEVQNFEHYGKKNTGKELFIFDSNDKTSYYRFIFDARKKIYTCTRCHNFGKSTEAVFKSENGQKIVEADSFHACEPLPYFEKVKTPDFLIRESTRGNPELVIFHENRDFCYQYYWLKSGQFFVCNKCGKKKNKRVTAKVWKLPNKEKFVQCYDRHHCEPIRYIPR